MELIETNTLKLTFEDASSVMLPKWFTDQFEYFTNLLEEIGVEQWNEDGTLYKYLELDLRNSMELSRLLTKPVLGFLKKYAYHTHILNETSKTTMNEIVWHTPDILQSKMILKYINDENYDELFHIYVAANYVGYMPLCHAITDEIVRKTRSLDIDSIVSLFKLSNESFTEKERKRILKKYEWNDI